MLCIGVLLIGESTVNSMPTSEDADIVRRLSVRANYKRTFSPHCGSGGSGATASHG